MRPNCWNKRQHAGIWNSIVPHGQGNIVIIQETFGAIIEKLVFQWLKMSLHLRLFSFRGLPEKLLDPGIHRKSKLFFVSSFYLSFQVEFSLFASFDDTVPDNDLIYIILISFIFSFSQVILLAQF